VHKIPEKFKGVQNFEIDHVTRATPFSGMVVRRLTLDIAYKHIEFDDCSFCRSRDISGGVKF